MNVSPITQRAWINPYQNMSGLGGFSGFRCGILKKRKNPGITFDQHAAELRAMAEVSRSCT